MCIPHWRSNITKCKDTVYADSVQIHTSNQKKNGAIVKQYVKLEGMRSLVREDDSFGFCQDWHLPGFTCILKFMLQYELTRYLTSSAVWKNEKAFRYKSWTESSPFP